MYRSLALLSLAAPALAQTAVSSDVYAKITRYTQFSAAAYADSCTTPPSGSSVVKYFNDNATDTQATLFQDDAAKELIIAYRGTSTPTDLDTDLQFILVPLTAEGTDCSACRVHQGFQAAYNALAADVTAQVESALSDNPGFTLTITGHSLGGGIAAIATAAFSGLGHTVTTYTFGEPLNGNAAWVQYIENAVPDSNYFRITHANDGVPQIPPTLLGYSHHGSEFWQREAGQNSAATTFACGKQSTTCNAAQNFGSNPINRAHLTYTGGVIGNSLNIVACGAEEM
ncbi:Alpha/Beta hydrolase protein [Aspergillus pseudoustus]|uniref:feruloyl esterase n=1 Tax=Aspergillus pseudoustus TaxID=1810923 RepID=A0ABR4KIF3_9EURO